MDLKQFIRDVPGFPQPGILFRDITPLLADSAAFRDMLNQLHTDAVARGAECIVGIESRGFIFGAPLADRIGLPFVLVRKEGKLPAARQSVEYSLEYGESRLDIHEDAMPAGTKAYIVDDLLATGGTALAAAKLVELIGGAPCGLGFGVELGFLSGRARLGAYPVFAVVRYD